MADDDLDDQYLVRRAIEEINIGHDLQTVNNGSQLLDRLLCKGHYSNTPVKRPDCILLDLNMPLLDGFQALNLIKANNDINTIPVYVLSTSRSDQDRERSLKLGAAAFYVKPTQFKELKEIVQEICSRISIRTSAEQYNPS